MKIVITDILQPGVYNLTPEEQTVIVAPEPTVPEVPIPPTIVPDEPKFKKIGRRYLALDPTLTTDLIDGRVSIKKFDHLRRIKINQEFVGGYGLTTLKDRRGMFHHYIHNENGYKHYTSDATMVNLKETSVKVLHRGTPVTTGLLQGMWTDPQNGWTYAIWSTGRDLWIATAEPDNYTTYSLWRCIMKDVKTDTHHTLLYSRDLTRFFVYGRMRGRFDWGSQSEVMMDRRGVRILSSGSIEEQWTTHPPIDPAVINPEYKKYPIKSDYYQAHVFEYHGNFIGNFATFFKYDSRPYRVTRGTGTGPIYPTIWHSLNGIDFNQVNPQRSFVPLHLFERRTNVKLSQPYEPEVGQIYLASMYEHEGDVYGQFIERWDTHYNAQEGQPFTKIWIGRITEDRFASIQPTQNNEDFMWNFEVDVPEDADDVLLNFQAEGVQVKLGTTISNFYSGDNKAQPMGLNDVVKVFRGKRVPVSVYGQVGEVFALTFGKVV